MTHLDLLRRVERCFEPGEIETLVWRSEGPVGRSDAAVRGRAASELAEDDHPA